MEADCERFYDAGSKCKSCVLDGESGVDAAAYDGFFIASCNAISRRLCGGKAPLCGACGALKTRAQTAVATIGTAAVFAGADWIMAASAAVPAAILSLLTSVADLPEIKE